MNLLSPRQMMNASFEPLHLVNTYGAFSSVTRERREIAIEGTLEERLTPRTEWREYQFKGKPGDMTRRSPQIAPYHLRLDWLMWFAAQALPSHHPWFATLLDKLLVADAATLRLLRLNPFPDRPPRYVRAVLHEYRFTTRAERRQTGLWWHREAIGLYVAPVSLPARRL